MLRRERGAAAVEGGGFEAKRPRTRYAIVRGRLANWVLPTTMPDRWLDRVIGRTMGLT